MFGKNHVWPVVGASAIERSPEAEYQSAFEQLCFTSRVARELVDRFVLVDERPERPHVAPYECAMFAIKSRASELQHLESIRCIAALASDIAQYGFVADACETFAQRIEGSGAPHDQTLSERLIGFIECTCRAIASRSHTVKSTRRPFRSPTAAVRKRVRCGCHQMIITLEIGKCGPRGLWMNSSAIRLIQTTRMQSIYLMARRMK